MAYHNLITDENIASLDELVRSSAQHEIEFRVAREDQTLTVPSLHIPGFVTGSARRLIDACKQAGFEHRYHFDFWNDLGIVVSLPLAERMQSMRAFIDDELVPSRESQTSYLIFGVHPCDFKVRSFMTHSPRLLSGPTLMLVQTLRRQGLRVRVIKNMWGSDLICAYKREHAIDRVLGKLRQPFDLLTA